LRRPRLRLKQKLFYSFWHTPLCYVVRQQTINSSSWAPSNAKFLSIIARRKKVFLFPCTTAPADTCQVAGCQGCQIMIDEYKLNIDTQVTGGFRCRIGIKRKNQLPQKKTREHCMVAVACCVDSFLTSANSSKEIAAEHLRSLFSFLVLHGSATTSLNVHRNMLTFHCLGGPFQENRK
jgi:hypothetical protein